MTNYFVLIAASTLICIGFIGNLITMGFIAVSKQLHTPTYVTIGCLAVADVLASVTRYVLILSKSFDSFFKDNSQSIYEIFTFLFIHSAFFHMALLTYVRFVFITNPLQSLKMTCTTILFMSCAVWMSSIAILLGYGVSYFLTLKSVISVETRNWCEIEFALYVAGIPFIVHVVIYFNFIKNYIICTINRPLLDEPELQTQCL